MQEITSRGKFMPQHEKVKKVMEVHGRQGGLKQQQQAEVLVGGMGVEDEISVSMSSSTSSSSCLVEVPEKDKPPPESSLAASVQSKLFIHPTASPLPSSSSSPHNAASRLHEAEAHIEQLQDDIASLQLEKKALQTRLKAAQHGAGVLGEEAAYANEELNRRTDLLERMEAHAAECEEENEALRRQLALAEQAKEDADRQQAAWEARCRTTEGMMTLLSEREAGLLQENNRLREELKHIRRRAQEYEGLLVARKGKAAAIAAAPPQQRVRPGGMGKTMLSLANTEARVSAGGGVGLTRRRMLMVLPTAAAAAALTGGQEEEEEEGEVGDLSMCLASVAPQDEVQACRSASASPIASSSNSVMALYAHPDFEAEFGGLVTTVFTEALRSGSSSSSSTPPPPPRPRPLVPGRHFQSRPWLYGLLHCLCLHGAAGRPRAHARHPTLPTGRGGGGPFPHSGRAGQPSRSHQAPQGARGPALP